MTPTIFTNYKGKYHFLHGHTYKILVAIKGDINRETGFIMNFINWIVSLKNGLLIYLTIKTLTKYLLIQPQK